MTITQETDQFDNKLRVVDLDFLRNMESFIADDKSEFGYRVRCIIYTAKQGLEAMNQLSTEQEKGDAWLDKVLSAPLPTTPQAEPELMSLGAINDISAKRKLPGYRPLIHDLAALIHAARTAHTFREDAKNARNAVMEIDADLQQANAEIARLREALATYAKHPLFGEAARKALQGEGS